MDYRSAVIGRWSAVQLDPETTVIAMRVSMTGHLAEALVGDPRFEAWRVDPADPIAFDSDRINTKAATSRAKRDSGNLQRLLSPLETIHDTWPRPFSGPVSWNWPSIRGTYTQRLRAAMGANREYWPWKVTVTVSVGPLRCLARMRSASPLRGDSGS